MLRQDLYRIVMRATRYQAKTECGNIRLCAGLKAGIRGGTHYLVDKLRESR